MSNNGEKSAEYGDISSLKALENDCFPEIGETHGIQQEKNPCFSSITREHDGDRSAYRRIHLYTKSMGQYKRERRRRRWIRLLA